MSKESELIKTRERLKKPHSSQPARAVHAAAEKLLELHDARANVQRELRDATFDAPEEDLEAAIEGAAKVQVLAVVALQVAEEQDPSEYRKETFFVRRALAWCDSGDLVFEVDVLLHRADQLDVPAEPAPAAEMAGG